MMNADEKTELAKMIRSIMHEELNVEHTCRFSVTDSEAAEFTHFVGMMKTVGEGELSNGIEIMRENHKWLHKQRLRGDKLSLVMIMIVISALISGILTALWQGVNHIIRGA